MKRKHATGKTSRIKRQVEWDYDPTERQSRFHKSPARFKLYGGAMGGGKSVALCAEAANLCLAYPGNRGYLCRHFIQDLKRSTMETFWRFVPREFIRKHWRDDRILEFWNGSEILYGGLGSTEDLDRIKSTEFGFFAIDEATETYEEYFLLLQSRLRWTLPDGSRPAYHGILASNPEPGWVKDRFVDRQLNNHDFIPALPADNPFLPEDYVSTLTENFPEEWIKRYLDGSWDVFEGQIYKEFNKEYHVYDDSELEVGEEWPRVRVIDHGYTNPTCCLWAAIDYDDTIWVYEEHYESGLTVEENARVIKRMTDSQNPAWDHFPGPTLIDPSCFSTTQVTRGKPCSIADEYRKNGIITISPYQRDGYVEEAVGINLVKARLKAKSIKIGVSCVNTIREIVRYRWKTFKASAREAKNLPEVPVDKENHAMDALRYLCCWRPQGAREKIKPPPPPGSIHYEIMKHKRRSRQQNLGFVGW